MSLTTRFSVVRTTECIQAITLYARRRLAAERILFWGGSSVPPCMCD